MHTNTRTETNAAATIAFGANRKPPDVISAETNQESLSGGECFSPFYVHGTSYQYHYRSSLFTALLWRRPVCRICESSSPLFSSLPLPPRILVLYCGVLFGSSLFALAELALRPLSISHPPPSISSPDYCAWQGSEAGGQPYSSVVQCSVV